MRGIDLMRLVILAAIWGASFLFMRILAPVLGALWTTEVRMGTAGIAMLLWLMIIRRPMEFATNWKQYLFIGLINSAIPSVLFSYAALTLPAGYSAILNATTPLWGAIVSAWVLGEKITPRKMMGFGIGLAGVAFLVRLGPAQFTPALLFGVLACLAAAVCYGIAGTYSKKMSIGISPPLMATGSQLAAAIVVLPFLPFAPIHGTVTPLIVMVGLGLALICSAIAYLLFFRLIADVGASKTLTVTFLIPLFALVWGALFLDEVVNINTLIGAGLVVCAIWLVLFPSSKA